MDPDACLSGIRSIVQHADDPDHPDTVEHRFDRLVDLIDGIDTWMSRGGYPPRHWQSEGSLRARGPLQEPATADDRLEEDGVDCF